MTLKPLLRDVLGTFGLLPVSRAIRERLNDGMSPNDRYRKRQLAEFKRLYGDAFGRLRGKTRPNAKRVLVLSGASGATSLIGIELCLAKALELAGCKLLPVILPTHEANAGRPGAVLGEYHKLLGSVDIVFWENFCRREAFHDKAEAVLNSCRSLCELPGVQFEGARVGGHALASTRRVLMSGDLDLKDYSIRKRLIEALAFSMASVVAAREVVQQLRPSLVLTDDTAYTPASEILDICVANNIPVIRWYGAHKDNTLILKRYNSVNRGEDENSLSDISWRAVRRMVWTGRKRDELKQELNTCYSRGDWYGLTGMQIDKCLIEAGAICRELGLDPSRKTAFIFPHIAWDASFGRGQDLFENYDEWFVETVRAACRNDKVQWVVKIHPRHIYMRHHVPATEEEILRRRIGRLPAHVSILPTQSDISTFSLFSVMDYCLTVRGTAGLEAACHGIPVLTGGAGRYDRKGFTIDSETPKQYLERIANIQDIPRLSQAQIDLAERYAYGLFLLRPLALSSVTIEHDQKYGVENFFRRVELNLRTREEWEHAADLKAFADWVMNSDEEDFLLPIAEDSIDCREGRRSLAAVG